MEKIYESTVVLRLVTKWEMLRSYRNKPKIIEMKFNEELLSSRIESE